MTIIDNVLHSVSIFCLVLFLFGGFFYLFLLSFLKALLEHSGKLKPSYGNILAIEPTGWTFSKVSSLQEIRPKYNRDGVKIYGKNNFVL